MGLLLWTATSYSIRHFRVRAGRGRAKGGGFVLLGRQKWSHRPPGVWAGWFGGPLGPHRLRSPCGLLGPSTDVPGGASRGLALLLGVRSTHWVCRYGK